MNALRFTKIALATTVALLPNIAAAQEEAPRMHVKIADLDLATPKGRHMLTMRIHVAADTVCDMPQGKTPLSMAAPHERCRREAIASAYQSMPTAAAIQLAAR